MKILIVPDVHGRDFWREAIKKDYDKIVFLGDYLDHYYGESTHEHDIETLKDIIDIKKSNPDKVILLIGNHDCPYIWKEYGEALGSYWCRHDYDNHGEISRLFTDNLDLFQIAWECENEKYGKVLFTHAGVTNGFARICGLNADEINNFFLKEKSGDISNVVGLASVSYYRGGDQTVGSPVWADVNEHLIDPVIQVFQIFGHTYSREEEITEHFAMLDTGKSCWILDENGLTKFELNMKINGLDLVNRPEIVLDIILNEYDGVDKVDVEQDTYDDNIVHINEDKYLILTYEEEEDIINDFNKSLFEEFLRDNVSDEAAEYIDDYSWHKANDVTNLEKCVDYDIELAYEKDGYSIFRIL